MIAVERLARLALGDLDDAETAETEEHVLACTACATTLERLVRIGDAARELIRAGGLTFPVTTSLADRMLAEGLVSRSYRLAAGAVVPCTVSATDIYALTVVEADFGGVTRATLTVTLPGLGGSLRMDDIPFDAARGTVSYVARSSLLRQLPSGRVTLELHANDPADRLLGRYFLDHTAFTAT
ncbi:MAG: hypothetical protein KF819_16315 [Labilithrix sp.]|nr:hypothetical protein [Labilithrix sp.]